MKHTPLTKQRSPWEYLTEGEILGYRNDWWQRRVGDGRLTACVAEEPAGWHLSISYAASNGEHVRYPTWDEQVHAVRTLLPPELTYAMFLPPDGDDYVGLHLTTFHWHEHPERAT